MDEEDWQVWGKVNLHHQRDVGLFVGAGVEEINLATAIFLGGRPEKLYSPLDTKLLQRERQADEAGNAGRSDKIVPAGVANVG